MSRTPSFPEVIRQVLDAHGAEMRVAEPARVERFHRTVQRVDVQPVVGERAQLVNVPVVFPGVYWDIQPGEAGVVIFADEDWRAWFRGGSVGVAPETTGRHSADIGLFLPGLVSRPDARTLPSGAKVVPASDLRLADEDATKRVLHDGFEAPFENFLDALGTWAGAVEAAITLLGGSVGSPWSSTVAPQVTALKAADYFADRVKVK